MPRSPWREFAFLFHQLRRAIEPALSLQETVDEWNSIAQALAESPRERVDQLSGYYEWE